MNMPRHIRREAGPGRGGGVVDRGRRRGHVEPAVRRLASASARFSVLMRNASTAAFSAVKISASNRQVQGERQQCDLAGHHRVVRMRQVAIRSARDQRLARQHEDARGPARAQRPHHPGAQSLEQEVADQRQRVDRLLAAEDPEREQARRRVRRRSADNARRRSHARRAPAVLTCCGAPARARRDAAASRRRG